MSDERFNNKYWWFVRVWLVIFWCSGVGGVGAMSDLTKAELIKKIDSIRYRTESTMIENGSAFDNAAILQSLIMFFEIDFQFQGDGTVWLECWAAVEGTEGTLIQAECTDKEGETIAHAVCELAVNKYELEHGKEDH